MSDHKCFRCGRCCHNGSDMFTLAGPPTGKCPQLAYDEKGRAVCLVQKIKPDVCRQYPFDSEPCELQKELFE